MWSRYTLTWGTVTYPGTDSRGNSLGFYDVSGIEVDPSSTGQHFTGLPLRCLSTAVEGEEIRRRYSPASHPLAQSPCAPVFHQ